MLVLTRKKGQRTMIDLPGGGTITVTLIRLEGSEARLGFDAPMECLIRREELLDRDWREDRR